jgi:hypothetical protein
LSIQLHQQSKNTMKNLTDLQASQSIEKELLFLYSKALKMIPNSPAQLKVRSRINEILLNK